MLHVHLLGPLEVTDRTGRTITPPGTREQRCLAILAVVAPSGLSTDRLATELYPDRATNDPRNAVQAVVSRLRKALGQAAGAVETTASGYRLVDASLDLDRAEVLLRAALAEPDPAPAAELLARAAELWRGPFLDGLTGPGSGALEAERVRLEGLRADAEDAVAERRLAAAASPDPGLVAELEAATRSQPWRERRWEQLMVALYRQGRQADALRAFQRARLLLGEELGLEPGPTLAALEGRILAHDATLLAPSPGPTPAAASAHHPAAGLDPFTGDSPLQRSGPDPLTGDDGSARPGPTPTASPLPAGTLSVVLCDVEGSVRRWEAAPAVAAAEIADLHRLWAEVAAAGGGVVVKSTGDGVLAVFPRADAAVRAAAAAVAEHDANRLRVRVAVHTGALEPTGHDYRGPVVNRCARLLELAHGGQILVSGPTAELARSELGPELSLVDLGLHWLRDVAQPTTVWQVAAPSLPAAFPPLRRAGTSLPRPRTALMGRDELVADVVELLGRHPLVTLIGPGGIGKTSLALAAAWEVSGRRPVTFVDLATVADPSAVADRLAHELAPGVHRDDERPPVDRIADCLRIGTDLIVVDNAEHVLDAVAATLDALLHHELKGSLLVTSRQPLGLAGEALVGIPPLDLPDHDADLDTTGRSPSVRLFLERARAARGDGPSGPLPSGLLPVVAHICRRLDGIPLAIELAAGRSSMLSLEDIAARLDDQLRLLRRTSTSRTQRHRSLEAVVGWSVEQLSPSARRLFARLSVMAGPFDLAGVEDFASLGVGPRSDDVLADLDELHGASLLVVDHGDGPSSRFRMLEPIRQVAAAELDGAGATIATREAHARWLIGLVTGANARRDDSRTEAYARLDRYADQLRGAVGWIADAGRADLAPGIAFGSAWWFLTRDSRAGDRLLGRLLDLVDREADPLGWASVVLANAVVTATHPHFELAGTALEALAVFDAHGHPDADLARVVTAFAQPVGPGADGARRLLAEAEAMTAETEAGWTRAVVDMAIMAMDAMLLTGDQAGAGPGGGPGAELVAAIERGQRAVAVFRRMGEPWAHGVTLSELGRLHHLAGDLEAAEACYLESLGLLDAADYHGSHFVYSALGQVATARGDHDGAERHHRRSLEIAALDANPGCVAFALAGGAESAEARGEPERAAELYRQALVQAERDNPFKEGATFKHGTTGWRAALDRLELSTPSPSASPTRSAERPQG